MNYKKIILIAGLVLAVFVGLIGIGYLRFQRFEHSMYPVAPPMPAVVSQTTDEILAQLESQLQTNAPWILTNLQPGLSAERINDLEHQASIKIPDDIKALYRWHDGFDNRAYHAGGPTVMGPMPMAYFLPLEEALQARQTADRDMSNAPAAVAINAIVGFTKPWIVIFDENDGNGFYFDPQRKPEQGAVFYHDMEDGEYVFFPSAKNLLAGLVKCYQTKAFTWQDQTNGAILNEDVTAAQKVWSEFGVNASTVSPVN